ncbi:hypothetical protein GGI25_006291 [Coemansia spiralis]|uniref:ADF-H domain-containing protein n=2 Tax=Coemansia TaxID=4863 RepID=A0A9W8G0P4_9FUNG|nr:hypothetical protein BX070DRAFT_240312 [Coemansia spiralis]KAJ1988685.1 hypothetical protein EDC05_005160 [Coemansia umbellata]KAJ2619855.1 hypothetical protein GGI26_005474 [Coemansia sp. RSA 1358]KAJ2668984.1 hypothetical protein GGI25_006291 [Coemansia spiralis]
MGLCDNPEIKQAYEDVRDDKSETTWILLEYDESSKSDVLQVATKGSGNIEELKTHLKEDAAAFGYIRVPMANDELSQRTKFVLISWCGPKAKVMRRAKLGVQKSELKKVLCSFSIEVPADDVADLNAKEILLLLKKAGGANYDRQNSDY